MIALQSIQTHITAMEESLLGVRQELKVIILAQRSNQEAKGIDIVETGNNFSEQKKTNGIKEIGSPSRNTKATLPFPSSDDSDEEEIEDVQREAHRVTIASKLTSHHSMGN